MSKWFLDPPFPLPIKCQNVKLVINIYKIFQTPAKYENLTKRRSAVG